MALIKNKKFLCNYLGDPQRPKRKGLTQLSFTSHKIYPYGWVYTMILLLGLYYPTQGDSFSSSIHLPESQVAISQKTRNQSTTRSSIFPKDAQSYYKDICSTMFIAVSFAIARMWKQPRCHALILLFIGFYFELLDIIFMLQEEGCLFVSATLLA